ncbi:HU family DNA-binding protein [Deinococcus maricopensis]|uniref:Histone family protein DNA-binding protein n=1 Tax=Deinococcus maricopensis (strain DSM 21211 / LMG 22137 / NRRL B-23946 / LB-34) TaxID=709986 RepID=E8U8U1_DEIML|nr:HU family DNA-binding protein [Deinococcus maricopensis]ADV67480.1 histone family protein DNA-binding protein [Deinococcus maricopensis DSM 21211]
MTKRNASKAAQTTTDQGDSAGNDSSKVGKTQLVDLVTDRTSLNRKQSAEAIDAALGIIVSALRDGKSVGLPGLGTFAVRATAERTGVKPGTSERITIAAGKKVGFKVASTLKGNL